MVTLSFGQTAMGMEKEQSLSGTITFLIRPMAEPGTPTHREGRLFSGEEAMRGARQPETALQPLSQA